MDTVTCRAYAKINLGLDVTGKREDGYHLVDMIMQTVGIFDTLTFSRTGEGTEKQPGRVSLSVDRSGLSAGADNLVCRAVERMRREYGISEGLDIRLEKRIPMAAGMAGGSTDAAAAFRAVRDLFVPEVTDSMLCELAAPLGADIPYCIIGGTRRAEGIGEVLTRLPDAPECRLVISKPPVDVPTPWVYRTLDSCPIAKHPDIPGMIRALQDGDLEELMRLSGNVLEPVTGGKYPVIGRLERFLEERGAIRAVMTGSGPTVFGVFTEEETAEKAFAGLNSSAEYGGFENFLTGMQNNG